MLIAARSWAVTLVTALCCFEDDPASVLPARDRCLLAVLDPMRAPPILLGLPLHLRRFRIFDLPTRSNTRSGDKAPYASNIMHFARRKVRVSAEPNYCLAELVGT